jgi:ubiquinone/menaquinone biosynthesis C-methylase UbiE
MTSGQVRANVIDFPRRVSSLPGSMNRRDAVVLLSTAIRERGGVWADLGAGEGTFSRALVELLGPQSRIYAVDRDASALASLEQWPDSARRNVIPVVADFSRPFELPGLRETLLDGMLFANALHFIPDADEVLVRLTAWVKPGGRVVFVEYDRRASSRWVPYPIPAVALPALAAAAGLSAPTITATRPSAYSGELYVAVATRTDSPPR